MKEKLELLYNECSRCDKCELHSVRTNVVFGIGNVNSRVMLIGEAPGENEDLKGEPFVGRAGKLLDSMLNEIGLSRSDIYIANIVKCRPPKNRDPLSEEKDKCIDWLYKQIEIIAPDVIVCLGRVAAAIIIDPKIKISIQHGQWIEKDGRSYMAMLHPAAILRNPNLKTEALNDFFTLKDKLSEK